MIYSKTSSGELTTTFDVDKILKKPAPPKQTFKFRPNKYPHLHLIKFNSFCKYFTFHEPADKFE